MLYLYVSLFVGFLSCSFACLFVWSSSPTLYICLSACLLSHLHTRFSCLCVCFSVRSSSRTYQMFVCLIVCLVVVAYDVYVCSFVCLFLLDSLFFQGGKPPWTPL